MRCAGKSSSMAALTTARPAVALLAAALALLLAAWVFGNPPGAAPDERAHYVRALGAGSLELEGAIFKPTREQTEAFFEQRDGPELPGAGVATVLWAAKQTRTFELPAELSVFGFGCNDQKPATSAACVERPTGDRLHAPAHVHGHVSAVVVHRPRAGDAVREHAQRRAARRPPDVAR